MYQHEERDNAGGVVVCVASVQSLCCFQHLFCHQIPGQHDRRCICYARYSENGCFINHPLFCLTFRGLTLRFHPLFVRHRGGIKDILDTQCEELEQLTALRGVAGLRSVLSQLVGQRSKMLVWH